MILLRLFRNLNQKAVTRKDCVSWFRLQNWQKAGMIGKAPTQVAQESPGHSIWLWIIQKIVRLISSRRKMNSFLELLCLYQSWVSVAGTACSRSSRGWFSRNFACDYWYSPRISKGEISEWTGIRHSTKFKATSTLWGTSWNPCR